MGVCISFSLSKLEFVAIQIGICKSANSNLVLPKHFSLPKRHLIEVFAHLTLHAGLARAQGILGDGGADGNGTDGAAEQGEDEELQVARGERRAFVLEIDHSIGKGVEDDLLQSVALT